MNQAVTNQDRYRATRRVTLIGAALDLGLGVVKLSVGAVAHSQALIADGVHSLSDVLTDGMVLFAAWHAQREPDENHPYGHGRFETIATVALAVFLVLVGAGIAWDAVQRMFHPDSLLRPGPLALAVAVISVVSKEWIYRYTLLWARRLRSAMLRANAWHSRSDAISSVVVIIGVAGTMAGLPYLDAVAAVLVAYMIGKIGWDLGWNAVQELVDTALDRERVAAIREEIRLVKGVSSLHHLRTRRMGGEALVDVHVQVDPKLSVSEGHLISETVRKRLIDRVDEVSDVLVHIDPEDDEQAAPSAHLPLRAEVLAELEHRWEGLEAKDRIEDVTLHYLQGWIDVEVLLPLDAVNDLQHARELAEAYRQAARDVPAIGELDVQFH